MLNKGKNSPNIADYDEAGYDYTKYWTNRSYSDKSERVIFEDYYKKLDEKARIGWFVDIGGSFGRLDSTHSKYFPNRIIFDYSFDSLKIAKEREFSEGLNFVSGNAYFTPFKSNSIKFATSVRLIHHIENLESFFLEVYRILEPGGIFFFEAANKVHFKAKIRNLVKFNFSFFNDKVYRQPISQEGLFLNYHPKKILKTLKAVGFEDVEKTYSGSNFRSGLAQKNPMQKISLGLDKKLAGNLFKSVNFGPSMFYFGRKPVSGDFVPDFNGKIEDILVRPKTYEKVAKEDLKNGVWDFRVK